MRGGNGLDFVTQIGQASPGRCFKACPRPVQSSRILGSTTVILARNSGPVRTTACQASKSKLDERPAGNKDHEMKTLDTRARSQSHGRLERLFAPTLVSGGAGMGWNRRGGVMHRLPACDTNMEEG